MPSIDTTEHSESSANSVNGESVISAAETPTSSTIDDSTPPAKKTFTPAPPPKVNIWKLRAEQATPQEAASTNGVADQPSSTVSEVVKSVEELKLNGSAPKKAASKGSNKSSPRIDDAQHWPSLDDSPSTADAAASVPLAPKISGKEKWIKYTPTITHATPLPPKGTRGGSSSRGRGLHRKSTSEAPDEESRPRDGRGRGNRYPNGQNHRQNGARSPSAVKEDGDLKSPSAANGFTDEEQRPMPRGRGSYRGRGMYSGATHGHHNAGFQAGSPPYQHYRSNSRSNGSNFGSREQFQYGFEYQQMGMVPMPMYDPMMARQMVLQQVDYYFSIENLCKDLFLRKHMDSEGFVNLVILANFNRVKGITMDYQLIRDTCEMSNVVELKVSVGAYDKIRARHHWQQWVLPEDQRDPSTQMVPPPQTEEVAGFNKRVSMSIGAPVFVPGMGAPYDHENENNEESRKLSPQVAEFKPVEKLAEKQAE